MSLSSTILQKFLHKYPSITSIHLHWVDLAGVLHSRVLPTSHCLTLTGSSSENEEAKLRLSPYASLSLLGKAPENFVAAAGASALVPDWTSLMQLSRSHASVMCNVSEAATFHPGLDPTDDPFKRCPRSQLQRLSQRVGSEFELSMLAGVELEFYLLDVNMDVNFHQQQPADDYGDYHHTIAAINNWSTASAMRTAYGGCVDACVEQLLSIGIVVEQYHAEQGFRQFEIALGPLPLVAAVDSCTRAQEVIKNVALKQGFRATFLPKPFKLLTPSGLHLHLSLRSHEQGSRREEDYRKVQEWFLAGMLDRLPLLCAFGMASRDSYLRVNQKCFSEWVAWGTENRNNPVRKVGEGHWELKCLDFTANIYLATAAFVAAGLLGIRQQTTLRWKDCRSHLTNLDEHARERLGITTPLPKSLEESLEILEQDYKGLDDILAIELLGLYLCAKKCELDALSSMSAGQVRAYYFREF